MESYKKRYGIKVDVGSLNKKKFVVDLDDIKNSTLPEKFPILIPARRVLYHLATVVDDYLFGVNLVVKGVDKQSNQVYQDVIRNALGFPSVDHVYAPLLKYNRLDFNPTYLNLLAKGYPREAILSYAFSSMYGDPDVVYFSIHDFVKNFTLRNLHSNDSIFDERKLKMVAKNIMRSEKYTTSMRVANMKKYLEVNGEEGILMILEKDGASELVVEESRPLDQLAVYLRSLINEDRDDIILTDEKKQIIDNIQKAIRNLAINGDQMSTARIFETLEVREEELSLYYQLLRWLLIGSISGLSSDYALKYFSSSGQLLERISRYD